MNRLVWDGSTPIRASDLPPETRASGAPARVLFIHGRELGFGTTARSLQLFAADRPDIDAVHVSLPLPTWAKVVAKEPPRWLGGWDFHNTRMTWAFGRSVEQQVNKHLPLERFDVVHIMTRERATLVRAPWVRALGARRPRFVVNIDATLAAWDRAFAKWRPAPKFDYTTDKNILAAADAVACASRWVMDSANADYGLREQKYILHMPCAPSEVGATVRAPDARTRRAATRGGDAHAGHEPLRIVFIGNDFTRKGGDRLLGWHQSRWKDRVEIHICSGDSMTERWRGVPGVTLHGRVEHARLVRELLPSMDLCVIPTWEDTFLIAAQEAQAAGLPVVSSRLAGIPEVVADGRTGTLCERADDRAFITAIERYLDDAALLERQSRAAAERAGPRGELDARKWHTHLLDQLAALADNRSPACLPAGVSAA